MKTNIGKEVKLINLMKLLEINGDGKWGIMKQISAEDKNFIKEKALEHVEGDLLSEVMRNNFRLRLFKIDNKENWIRFSPDESEKFRREILINVFNPKLEETDDTLTKELALGNMIEVVSIQSKNGFMNLTEEQTDYLNNLISNYKEELNKKELKQKI